MARTWVAPVPIPPVAPDYHVCDAYYGQSLRYIDCVRAASTLKVGEDVVPYHVNPPGGLPSGDEPLTLPIYKKYGSLGAVWVLFDSQRLTSFLGLCMVSVELGGPTIPQTVRLRPNDVRGMAGWAIDQCVIDGAGSGGFVTKGLLNLINYVADPATDIIAPYRMSASALLRQKVYSNL